MLSKSISTSLKLNELDEFAQLLFTWMIPHTDDFGCMDGEPVVVKALVMPLSRRKPEEFTKALYQMAKVGLIYWYSTDGKAVIRIKEFEREQQNLSKRTASKFPPIKEESVSFQEILGNSKKFPINLTELNRTELNRTEPNQAAQVARQAWWEGEAFNCFYQAYPKRKNRGQAERAWSKLVPTEQLLSQILAAIERAKTSEQWAKDGGRFIPFPATWLNAKGWEDEDTEVTDGLAAWSAKQDELERQGAGHAAE